MKRFRMRQMRPRDVAAIDEACRQQNRRDGTSYPVPPVFDSHGRRSVNVPLALVAVDEHDQAVMGHVFERTVEMCSFGDDPRALAVSLEAIEGVAFVLREKGYRHLHVQVPLRRGGWIGQAAGWLLARAGRRLSREGRAIEKALSSIGFTRDDQSMAHFFREL